MSSRVAFITGITGQDGSYLAEFLLGKGYEVHGLIRRSSSFNTGRIDHIYQDPHDPNPKLFLHYGDLLDGVGLTNLIREIQPDEVYNLAAQSHVMVSLLCLNTPVKWMVLERLGFLRQYGLQKRRSVFTKQVPLNFLVQLLPLKMKKASFDRALLMQLQN